jgi:hypothetical protein
MVFDDAEIARIFAVFFAVDAAPKHDQRRVPDLRLQRKILGLHSTVFSDAIMRTQHLSTKIITKKPENARNCEDWAKLL